MTGFTVVAGVVLCGLVAGLFWGWEVAMRPGLADVDDDDDTFVSTMQSVNSAIVNPVFLLAFFGAGIVLGAAAVLEWRAGNTRRAAWLGAASAAYLLGVFGVTVAGNVPLNDQLAAFDLGAAGPDQIHDARVAYEAPWNRLHRIRSVVNVAALAIAAVGATVPASD